MTSTTRTHGPAGALPSPAGRAVRSPQPERGAAAAGADRHPGLASAALRPGVPAAVRGGGPALRSAAVAGKFAMLELIARVPLPGVGERDLRHAHPPASARRAGPAGVRPAGGEPLAAGQRAVAPAHPQRPGYARRGETLGAAPLGDPAADRHGLLPPGLAAVRGQTGLELPAQRPLRRPRPNTSTCSTSPNTELEHQPDPGAFAADYGRYAGPAWPTCSARSDTTSAPTNRKPRAAHLRLPGAPPNSAETALLCRLRLPPSPPPWGDGCP